MEEELLQREPDTTTICLNVNGENTSPTSLDLLMQDFKNAAPAKMHSKLLVDKIKYLNSLDEEVNKMCNIVEEYVAERVAEIKAETEKEITISKLYSVKNLMTKIHWTAEEAMDAIGLPKPTKPDISPYSNTAIPQISRRNLRLILII